MVVFVFVFISVFCPCVWRQLPEELGLTGPLYLGHIVLLFCLGFVFYVVFLFDRAFLRQAYRILFWLCIFYFVLYFALTGPLGKPSCITRKVQFFEHCSNGGGVKPMLKNFVANIL